jgi:hypothetical protein
LADLEAEVGINRYEIQIEDIKAYYSLYYHQKPAVPTLYKWIQQASNQELFIIEKKTVKSYTLHPRTEIKSQYVKDSDGNIVLPSHLPEWALVEEGEKRLTFYHLTNQGKALLTEATQHDSEQ